MENIQSSLGKLVTSSPAKVNSQASTDVLITAEVVGNSENIEPASSATPKATKTLCFSEATQIFHPKTTTPATNEVTSAKQTSSFPTKRFLPSKKSSPTKIGSKSLTTEESVNETSSTSSSSSDSEDNPNLANPDQDMGQVGEGDTGEEGEPDGEENLGEEGALGREGNIGGDGDHDEARDVGGEEEIVPVVASTSVVLQSGSSSDESDDDDPVNDYDVVIQKIAEEIRETVSKIRKDETLELLDELEERLTSLDSVLNQIKNDWKNELSWNPVLKIGRYSVLI